MPKLNLHGTIVVEVPELPDVELEDGRTDWGWAREHRLALWLAEEAFGDWNWRVHSGARDDAEPLISVKETI